MAHIIWSISYGPYEMDHLILLKRFMVNRMPCVVNRYHTWVEMNEIRSEAVCKTYHRKKKYHNRHLLFALEKCSIGQKRFYIK